MAVIHGRNLKVSIGSTLIGWAKSCTVTKNCDMIEVAPTADGTARQYIAGRTDWQIEVSGLMTNMATIMSVGSSVTLAYTDGSTSYGGSAIVKQAKHTGTVGNLAQQSCVFQGTGSLH